MTPFHCRIPIRPSRTYITCIMILVAFYGYGQDLPKVIQPSPEAAALFRFMDYPMDYSTGLPQISIPLYEVKSGSLSVPISISNHASGRRVNDQDGPIALGWSLNAGGMISRTSYGSADFGTPTYGTYNFPYPFKTTGLTNSDVQYLGKIAHYDNVDANLLPWTESEYDVFSYSIGSGGGKFVFKDNNGVKTAALLPYKPYIITPYYTFQGLSGIDITDDKGTLYKFLATEFSGASSDNIVTGLAIKQMISADKIDTINFKYTGFGEWRLSFSQQRILIGNWAMDQEPYPSPAEAEYTVENSDQGFYQIARLTEIDFKQGKVLFNLVTGSDKIVNIQVMNTNNEIIKTIQFNRSQLDYFTQGGASGSPNMTQINNKLDSLVFKDNTGNSVENYSFQYYLGPSPLDLHSCDWWGFYNASGMINMIPQYTLTGFGGGSGTVIDGGSDYNREPSLSALKSGVLRKIIYPTGGSTEFIYENNQYVDASNNIKNGPGLRIAQINTDDNRGTINTKTYKYGVAESGYGFLDLKPSMNTMSTQVAYGFFASNQLSPNRAGTYSQTTFYSGFAPGLSAMADRPVIYTEVAEYHGTQANNIGKTVYDYDNFAWAPSGMFVSGGGAMVPKYHIYSCNYWNNPVLTKQTDYKAIQAAGAISYQKKKETSNAYTITNIDDVAGLHVQRLYVLPQKGILGPGVDVERWAALYQSMNVYTFSDYHIPVGVKNLTSTTESLYNDDGSAVVNTVSYSYNTKQYLAQKTSNTSDGAAISTQITYPFDYTGNAVLTQMTDPSHNMLNFPIEQNEFRNSTPIKGIRTNYSNFQNRWGLANPMILPQTVDVKKGTNAYETRLVYQDYDKKGNLTSVAKQGDLSHAYIWDYNYSYPVADIATPFGSSSIAYTSFEADGSGNWIVPSTLKDNTYAFTGKQSYNLSNGAISIAQNGLDPTIWYTLSYWSKNGMYQCPDASSVKTGGTINGWTYYEARVFVSSSGTTSISGSGLIDEVRLYPEKAQMTTYTYTPLVGMTSSCDASNKVTYYEYDGFGRLKLIRDINGNILKTFKYQYQSTTP